MIVNISEEKQYLLSEPRLQEFNQTNIQAKIPEKHQEKKAVEQL